jgi:hypothetical protein
MIFVFDRCKFCILARSCLWNMEPVSLHHQFLLFALESLLDHGTHSQQLQPFIC